MPGVRPTALCPSASCATLMAKSHVFEPTALGAFSTPALALSGGYTSSDDTFSAPDVAAASLELIVTAIIGRGFSQMVERAAPERSNTGEALFLAHFDVVERAIDFVCSRNHLAAADADDFSSYVKLRMVEDDYEVP